MDLQELVTLLDLLANSFYYVANFLGKLVIQQILEFFYESHLQHYLCVIKIYNYHLTPRVGNLAQFVSYYLFMLVTSLICW